MNILRNILTNVMYTWNFKVNIPIVMQPQCSLNQTKIAPKSNDLRLNYKNDKGLIIKDKNLIIKDKNLIPPYLFNTQHIHHRKHKKRFVHLHGRD